MCCVPTEDVMTFGCSDGMCFASDGSVEGTRGAFGWATSHEDGTRTLSNSGPARGATPGGSFRAEGCGQLSWLRFTKHVQMCTQQKWKGEIDAWTDNESLVDKASEVRKWQQRVPANTLTSDWDAVKTIVDTMRELEQGGTPANMKWVKGHQDNKTQHSALPMEAQMNCKADLEAFQHQRELGGTRDKVF